MNKAVILLLMLFILISPVSANVFVSDPSNGIITAPAASYTNNQLIFSDKNPNQAVLNYVNGMGHHHCGGYFIKWGKSTCRFCKSF